MKLLLDQLLTGAGWGGTGAVYAVNELTDYIAGNEVSSTIFKFTAINQYLEKSIAADLTEYDTLTISLWSRNLKRQGQDYLNAADFAYKIGVYNGASLTEYYLPTYNTFEPVSIKITGGPITKIRITILNTTEDYLIVSGLLASKDELPLDIYQGLKEQLEWVISNHYDRVRGGVNGAGILIGTVTTAAGQKWIDLGVSKYVQKYSVIKIIGTGGTETHIIEQSDELQSELGQLYDGPVTKHSHTNSPVYLVAPVNFGLGEKEIFLPGIAIWGMPGEELPVVTKTQEHRHTYGLDNSVRSEYNPVNIKYTLQVDCEARHNELIAFMASMVRRVVAAEYLWVNGKRYNVRQNSVPTFIDPVEGYNEIPKISILIDIEIFEHAFDSSLLVGTTAVNATYNIRS